MPTPEQKGVEKRVELRHDRRFTIAEKSGAGDNDHGYVTGFAIVCKVKGVDYYDLQDEHVPEDVAEAAAIEFMKAGGDGKIMHEGAVAGRIVESFFLSTAKAKALCLAEPDVTGWIVSFAPASAEIKKRFTSGELTGFSIGGVGWVVEEEVEAA